MSANIKHLIYISDDKFIIDKSNNANYYKILQAVKELVPTIYTFGILTAEYPLDVQESKQYNQEANEALEKFLIRSGYGFIKVKGHYQNKSENSYFVPNISRSSIMYFGKVYKQDSVIHGKMIKIQENMVVEMIKTYPNSTEPENVVGETIGISEICVGTTENDDFYAKVKGQLFNLDFLLNAFPDVWLAEHGALKITDSMSSELIERLNMLSNSGRGLGTNNYYCRKMLQQGLYKTSIQISVK